MKKKNWLVILITCILFSAFSMNAMAKDKRTVERGMTKQEVIDILGKPRSTSFNQDGEQWIYFKYGSLLDTHSDRITVGFDLDSRVISYQDILVPANSDPADDRTSDPLPQSLPGRIPLPLSPYGGFCLNEHDFSILYNKVKNGNFDDNKYDLIEVASLGCYYTCSQCARIMGLFSFADDKLKALRMMARHIVDPQDAYSIYRMFDFNDDKDKAAQIIQNR